MSRDVRHKKLVDAIIDGEVDAAALAQQAKEIGARLTPTMMNVSRELVKRRLAGKLTPAKAKWLFERAFVSLSLAAFANVAGKIEQHAIKYADAMVKAAREVEDVHKVEAIRDVDFKARELEKAGVTNDQGIDPNA